MPLRLGLMAVAMACVLALIASLMAPMSQASDHRLSPQAQRDLEALSAQIQDIERETTDQRQSARQIAQQIEDLRSQTIQLAKGEGTSEARAAIYRARLETLNIMEQDLTQKLGRLRSKQSRLLSALQFYRRNPPPAIFISSRRANDAVMAAILMRAITPELKKRTLVLSEQNRQLITLRRQAALQSEALFVTESDVSEQRSKIESLMAEREKLEDALLAKADQLDAKALALKARAARLSEGLPLTALLGLKPQDPLKGRWQLPVIGEKLSGFDGAQSQKPYGRGVAISTAAGAQVVSPYEAHVDYAGPLPSYGQVIILDVGQAKRIVLTGIGRVYVEAGAQVAKGEPLGRMPNLSQDKSTLYLEVRRGDQPVNPATDFSF